MTLDLPLEAARSPLGFVQPTHKHRHTGRANAKTPVEAYRQSILGQVFYCLAIGGK